MKLTTKHYVIGGLALAGVATVLFVRSKKKAKAEAQAQENKVESYTEEDFDNMSINELKALMIDGDKTVKVQVAAYVINNKEKFNMLDYATLSVLAFNIKKKAETEQIING